MLDLYADWCVACKEFEKYTFSDANVVKELRHSVLMQIDLTDSSDANLAFQERFSVLGLPTIMFFDGPRTRARDCQGDRFYACCAFC